MKRSQVLIFILAIVALFTLNKVFLGSNPEISEEPEMIDHDYISSQRLFDNTWKIIRDNYYDAELNTQAWARWKEHYHGKISKSI